MKGLIYDTSVYIQSWRSERAASAARRLSQLATIVDKQPVYLSSVVLQELYVGGIEKRTQKEISKIEKRFRNVNRLVTPNLSDWITTGQILSKIGQKYGFELVKLSRMTNDCLIAVSARRLGLTIVTINAGDFQQIAEFRPCDLKIFTYS